jgi:hypothetical protein
MKLSIRIKLAKLKTRINTAFLECQNWAKLAQFTKKCSQTAKSKQTLYSSYFKQNNEYFINLYSANWKKFDVVEQNDRSESTLKIDKTHSIFSEIRC